MIEEVIFVIGMFFVIGFEVLMVLEVNVINVVIVN